MSRQAMTDAEREELAVMLHAYFPGRVPDVTARAWLMSLSDRRADDVALGIKAMAETTEFPSLKALRDAVEGVVAARAARQREQDDARLLAAYASRGPVDRGANLRLLGALAKAVLSGASAGEISMLVEQGTKEVKR